MRTPTAPLLAALLLAGCEPSDGASPTVDPTPDIALDMASDVAPRPDMASPDATPPADMASADAMTPADGSPAPDAGPPEALRVIGEPFPASVDARTPTAVTIPVVGVGGPWQVDILGIEEGRVVFDVPPTAVEPTAVRFTTPADQALGVVSLSLWLGDRALDAGSLSLRGSDGRLTVEGAPAGRPLPEGVRAWAAWPGSEPGSALVVGPGAEGLALHVIAGGGQQGFAVRGALDGLAPSLADVEARPPTLRGASTRLLTGRAEVGHFTQVMWADRLVDGGPRRLDLGPFVERADGDVVDLDAAPLDQPGAPTAAVAALICPGGGEEGECGILDDPGYPSADACPIRPLGPLDGAPVDWRRGALRIDPGPAEGGDRPRIHAVAPHRGLIAVAGAPLDCEGGPIAPVGVAPSGAIVGDAFAARLLDVDGDGRAELLYAARDAGGAFVDVLPFDARRPAQPGDPWRLFGPELAGSAAPAALLRDLWPASDRVGRPAVDTRLALGPVASLVRIPAAAFAPDAEPGPLSALPLPAPARPVAHGQAGYVGLLDDVAFDLGQPHDGPPLGDRDRLLPGARAIRGGDSLAVGRDALHLTVVSGPFEVRPAGARIGVGADTVHITDEAGAIDLWLAPGEGLRFAGGAGLLDLTADGIDRERGPLAVEGVYLGVVDAAGRPGLFAGTLGALLDDGGQPVVVGPDRVTFAAGEAGGPAEVGCVSDGATATCALAAPGPGRRSAFVERYALGADIDRPRSVGPTPLEAGPGAALRLVEFDPDRPGPEVVIAECPAGGRCGVRVVDGEGAGLYASPATVEARLLAAGRFSASAVEVGAGLLLDVTDGDRARLTVVDRAGSADYADWPDARAAGADRYGFWYDTQETATGPTARPLPVLDLDGDGLDDVLVDGRAACGGRVRAGGFTCHTTHLLVSPRPMDAAGAVRAASISAAAAAALAGPRRGVPGDGSGPGPAVEAGEAWLSVAPIFAPRRSRGYVRYNAR